MISDRERWLMRAAMNAAPYYNNLDVWLSEVISDSGHIVEQHLSHDADQHALHISSKNDL